MTDNNIRPLFKSTDDRVAEMAGPLLFGQKVIVEGRSIPGLTMQEIGDKISLVVDGRFAVDFPREIAPQAAWLIANALAIGAGYPSANATSKDQPFAPIVFSLGEVPK